MDSFTRGLFLDLSNRCSVLQRRLADAVNDVDRRSHAREINETLTEIRRDIDRLLRDPNAMSPQLNADHLRLYRRWAERESFMERYVVPPLERFTEHDRRLTRLVRKTCEQIGWPLPAPMVISDSDSGYMTYMQLLMIKVPAAEDESILAYPDLAHELAHILSMRFRNQLIGDFENHLSKYISQEMQKSPPLSPQLFEQWRNYWLEEYLCDMVAVYLGGAAFGMQHRRLVSGYPARAFQNAPSHPADSARLRGAVAVLRKMGDDAGADDIQQLWDQHLANTGEKPTAEYRRTAPDFLIDLLADRVVEGCRRIGLRAFDARPRAAGDIFAMITEAWQRLRSDPDTYHRWEAQRLRQLWKQLGLDTAQQAGGARGPQAPERLDGGELAA